MSEAASKFVLSDDTVQVSFFSIKLHSDIAAWDSLCDNINQTIKEMTENYIWHKDEMKVFVSAADDVTKIPIHLKSITCFGDNIEDEWFIVYLVKQISSLHDHLFIQLEDNDGDFMLIESANYLPKWANPENTENRVFLYNQHIHLIPPSIVDLKVELKQEDAIRLIDKHLKQTMVSPEIEKAIFSRIEQYPQKIMENIHHAVVRVPLDTAALLLLKPSCISAFVDSYCNRDLSDLKTCQNIDYENTVSVTVKFTKCLYAMLMHAKLLGNVKNKILENDKSGMLGLKLTCGFTMFTKRKSKDILSTIEFAKYIDNLKENGYFQNFLEHSVRYNELMDKAKQYFLSTNSVSSHCLTEEIHKVMSSDDFSKLKCVLKDEHTSNTLIEDSDEWLKIDSNQLNELLQKQYGQQINFNKDELVTPQTIKSTLNDFLNQTSDFEGIETQNLNDSEKEELEFNPDEFVDCVEKMLNIITFGSNDQNSESDLDFDTDDKEDDEMDQELASKLNGTLNTKSDESVAFNLKQSIKEEDLSGPSSNLLKSIRNVQAMLDSDDE